MGGLTPVCGMRGLDVHYATPSAAEIPRWLYLGSCETSVCLLRRMSSVVGRGAGQIGRAAKSIGLRFSPYGMDASDFKASTEVRNCDPVSVIIKTRSGALWRAPPPSWFYG
jgi:hypothetical protein